MAQFSGPDVAGDPPIGAAVIDAAGNTASIVDTLQQGGEAQAWLRLAQGAQVLVPLGLLVRQTDGAYRLPFAFHSLSADEPVQMSFPLMEEEVHVAKRVVDTGRGLRVHKTVAEREQRIAQTLQRDELLVERISVGRALDEDEVPQTRYEGDTLVVPVLEEVLVVRKQLLLKEEVRVTRRRHEEVAEQNVLLRSEQVSVERFNHGSREGREGRE